MSHMCPFKIIATLTNRMNIGRKTNPICIYFRIIATLIKYVTVYIYIDFCQEQYNLPSCFFAEVAT